MLLAEYRRLGALEVKVRELRAVVQDVFADEVNQSAFRMSLAQGRSHTTHEIEARLFLTGILSSANLHQDVHHNHTVLSMVLAERRRPAVLDTNARCRQERGM